MPTKQRTRPRMLVAEKRDLFIRKSRKSVRTSFQTLAIDNVRLDVLQTSRYSDSSMAKATTAPIMTETARKEDILTSISKTFVFRKNLVMKKFVFNKNFIVKKLVCI